MSWKERKKLLKQEEKKAFKGRKIRHGSQEGRGLSAGETAETEWVEQVFAVL